MTVVRELDKIKTEKNNKGAHTRKVLKYISDLKDNSDNSLTDGIERPCGGTLRIEINHKILQEDSTIEPDAIQTEDDVIIVVTKNLSTKDNEHILMTQDRSMSIIAETWGVKTVQHSFVDTTSEIPKGIIYVDADPELINKIHKRKRISLVEEYLNIENIRVNNAVILQCGSLSAIGIYDGNDHINLLNADDDRLFNLKANGVEQKIASSLITGAHNGVHKEEFLASLSGRPGGGKSTIAISAGLKLITEGKYDRMLIFRPTVNLSSNTDLGYLPGDIDSKLAPWKEAVNDVLRGLDLKGLDLYNKEEQDINSNNKNKNKMKPKETSTIRVKTEYGTSKIPIDEIISVEPINYIRGRTFTNTYVVIDEAQNLEPGELRTLLTRFGKGSACVLTWDQGQIDNNFIRSGKAEGPLTILEKTQEAPNVFHIDLPRSVRGGISELFY